jgi:hypothetical protein
VTPQPSCLSELDYAALLQYSPDGKTAMSQMSREHVLQIKRGSPFHMDRIGLRSAECSARGQLAPLSTQT